MYYSRNWIAKWNFLFHEEWWWGKNCDKRTMETFSADEIRRNEHEEVAQESGNTNEVNI